MPEKEDEIIQEIKDRFKEAYDASDENYQEAINDLTFLKGDTQWPDQLKQQRESDGRPCLVINKIPVFCDQIIGDIRQNEPSIKIKPVDSKADPETARILTGLIRNIEIQNQAEVAYDTAAESMVQCGVGAWRIGTDYADDDQFEQDITISRIKNPFTVYWDPGAQKWDKSDARYCFVTEKVPREEFERMYPDKTLQPFDGGKDRNFYWSDDKTIRVVEYWKKDPVKKTLYLVQKDGGEIYVTEMKPDPEKLGPGWQILKQREVESHKIMWWKASQAEILEGPVEWPGKYIPIVMCYGKELNIEGQTYYRGVVRNSKDPQRLYNYSRSTSAETISLAPKAPYLLTAKQMGPYQKIWDQANKKSFPYLPYEPDPQAPGPPQRIAPVVVNTGIQNEVIVADQEIRDTTGLQQSNLGQKSNEKSGRAILARQREGDIANFAYYDNLARAIQYAGRVLVDLIPKIYDTPRIVRIMGRDEKEEFVPVNQPVQQPGPNGQPMEKIYDLTVGKYDVVVTIGPSYTTEREEAANNMLEFMKAVPPAGPLIADLLAKNMDWPGADEIERRLKLLLPPQLQTSASPGAGGPPPPPAPPPPDPLMLMQIKKAEAEAQGAAIDNETKFHKLQRLKQGLPSEPSDPMQHQLEREKMAHAREMAQHKEKGNASKER